MTDLVVPRTDRINIFSAHGPCGVPLGAARGCGSTQRGTKAGDISFPLFMLSVLGSAGVGLRLKSPLWLFAVAPFLW